MKIAITTGDVNGIGIENMIKTLQNFSNPDSVEFVFYGSTSILKQWLEVIDNSIIIEDDYLFLGNNKVLIQEISSSYQIEIGEVCIEAGRHAADALELCVADTIGGKNDAIVTLPIAKEAMYLAGWKYPGHTEMLAANCHVAKPLMILFKDNLRAALVTIHSPLREIADRITKELVLNSIENFNLSLKNDFGIASPKIAVLGLNPHAGENGNIGTEEIEHIIPAIKLAKKSGINCEGPFPADGFFAHQLYKNYDGYLAMYHDQGLIPLKLIAAGGGVNFTAGLPIVRTSPDHGTAFGIAGKNIANHQSTLDAIEAAIAIANNRK
ncbi:MAG: 4-hydroxythreonine-4-phosphate dehydrogenase PdxA [Candidatus Kapabacteria bacterium]|nr:4-hydroxythreonine-4-phosphate dehydrogenase PdxA [Ignavibacteriota bacterium]MCW5883597.1 4-hydroxythreonine-4-phosphate dehydrogenase PdxA [Candidatus Kapabacteria bacterium]